MHPRGQQTQAMATDRNLGCWIRSQERIQHGMRGSQGSATPSSTEIAFSRVQIYLVQGYNQDTFPEFCVSV